MIATEPFCIVRWRDFFLPDYTIYEILFSKNLIHQQAQIVAYVDDYRLMIFTKLPSLLLLFLMRRPRRVLGPAQSESHAAME